MLKMTTRWKRMLMKVVGAATLKTITKMQNKMMMTQVGKCEEEPIV
jgi:hypothetical protein